LTNIHHVKTIAKKFLRSWGQRSKSDSDGHGNLVHLIAPKPLNGFEQTLTKYLQ